MPDPAIRRLVHKLDFERVLATPTRSRSVHFAVHHVSSGPQVAAGRGPGAAPAELSTADAPKSSQPVDDLPAAHWLGSVIPKRHARRSVTRSLLKRQIRSAMARHAAALPRGLWLVRLRAPFAPAAFRSAASDALRRAAHDELDQLLARAAR